MQPTAPALGALCAILASSLAAQDWARLFPLNAPPGLAGHAMAYDPVNGTTILFGGGKSSSAADRIDETWSFDGTIWTKLTPAVSPPPRAAHAMAYDLLRARAVVFGGIGITTGLLSDTWEWDGTNWQQMTPLTVPPTRRSFPMVYDPARGKVVMHGGYGPSGVTLTDTWEWDGVDWTQIVTANAPTPLRYAMDMAFDPLNNGLVLFGGYPGSRSDTWFFNNTNWVQLTPAHTPPGRYDHQMVTDLVRSKVVMFGGPSPTADTWEFDGTDWMQSPATTLPPARSDGYMVYDLLRGQVLLFGGAFRNDTWIYQTPPQPSFAAATVFGTGCVEEARASIYESYASGTFDLSNTTFRLLPTTDGYVVSRITPQWFAPTSASLGLGDETESGPHALGFTLNYPGGSTSNIYMISNGFLRPLAGGSTQYNPNVNLLLGGTPRWAPVWTDLNPGAGGSTHYDVDPTNGTVYFTWLNVPEYNRPANLVSAQVALFTNGTIEYRYQSCTVTYACYTAWSPGSTLPGVAALDPGATDLSAITTPVVTAPDKTRLWLRSDLRPKLGNTVHLTTGFLPPSAPLVAQLLGWTEFNPGIDLTPIGMPGCFRYTSSDASLILLPGGGLATMALPIPNAPYLIGSQVKAQSAALVPGHTPLGATSSNGLRLTLDAN